MRPRAILRCDVYLSASDFVPDVVLKMDMLLLDYTTMVLKLDGKG